MSFKKINRKIHFRAAIIIALPLLVVIGSGLLLQVKKQVPWVQPATMKGVENTPYLMFKEILSIAETAPHAGIKGWRSIDRLDVRPKKGVVKVHANNGWEVQIDNHNGTILAVEKRRSDIIEAIHDGSWFHEHAKLWVFLPAAVVLFFMWVTGIYLFIITLVTKSRTKKKRLLQQKMQKKQ